MKRYIPCGCKKCDFSEKPQTRACIQGRCSSYEESYMECETKNTQIGYASLEEFNKQFGTHWEPET